MSQQYLLVKARITSVNQRYLNGIATLKLGARINALSSLRDNIHTFQAGRNGARGIDISTYHGPDVGFSFLDIAATPKETERRTFEAAWKGQSV